MLWEAAVNPVRFHRQISACEKSLNGTRARGLDMGGTVLSALIPARLTVTDRKGWNDEKRAQSFKNANNSFTCLV